VTAKRTAGGGDDRSANGPFEQAACCPIRPGRGTLGRPDACQRETNPVPSELCHPATSFPCKNKARDETDAPNASQEQRDKVLDAYDAMRPEFTDSNAFGRVALDIADGARFTALLRRYLDEQSPQRAPALFSSVRPLYASVPGAAEQCLAVMRGRLDGAASEKEKPWVHHFIAKHHDYFCETEVRSNARQKRLVKRHDYTQTCSDCPWGQPCPLKAFLARQQTANARAGRLCRHRAGHRARARRG